MTQAQPQQGLNRFMDSLLADDSRYDGLDLVVTAIADGVRDVNTVSYTHLKLPTSDLV